MVLSYDAPDTPLHQVTFCVVDLETTGASVATCAITEVGAARFRGGECLGTFQTLVDAGMPVSPVAARITGISDELLVGAPSLPGVLAALLEFAGGAVLVGHNLRFDVSFLDTALAASQQAGLRLRMVDTVALARRLVGDDAPDCRLATLAGWLGLDHQPRHRALDDVMATAELLHALLERAAGLGVTTLDDLLVLPRLAGHPQAAKLALTADLPRSPGVYLFRDARGQPLYVGRARDIRRRVRSFFALGRGAERGAEGRTVRQLLRAVDRIEHAVTASSLASAVAEVRLVQAVEPRHHRRAGRWRTFRYVRLPVGASGRPAVVPTAAAPGTYLGPLPSVTAARAVAAAAAIPSGEPPGEPAGPAPTSATDLATAWRWHARIDALRRADRVVLALPGGHRAELRRGRLVMAPTTSGPLQDLCAVDDATDDGREPLPRQAAEELEVVAAWIDRSADRTRLDHVDGALGERLATVPELARRPAPTTAATTTRVGHQPRTAPPLRPAPITTAVTTGPGHEVRTAPPPAGCGLSRPARHRSPAAARPPPGTAPASDRDRGTGTIAPPLAGRRRHDRERRRPRPVPRAGGAGGTGSLAGPGAPGPVAAVASEGGASRRRRAVRPDPPAGRRGTPTRPAAP